MRRLIDADLLMEKLNVFNDREHGNEHFLYGIETAKELLEDVPTAYDVEKVVEELQGLSNAEADYYYANSNDVIDREDAIEIVRSGGVE